MIDEVRMWREKIRHREELYAKNEGTVQLQSDRMATLEKENQKLMEAIQSLDSKINFDPVKDKAKNNSPEMEELNKKKQEAKEKLEQKQKESRLEIKQMQKEIAELSAKRDALMTRAKELNQEQRISSFKLKEVGRVLKHNQLKPISPEKHKMQTDVDRSDDDRSKRSMGKRSSTSNLLAKKDSSKALKTDSESKKLEKNANTQSTQLLNKKQYSKKKNEDSDEDLEKNQVIDYEKFKKQQQDKDKKDVKLGSVKATKGAKNTFETKTSLK